MSARGVGLIAVGWVFGFMAGYAAFHPHVPAPCRPAATPVYVTLARIDADLQHIRVQYATNERLISRWNGVRDTFDYLLTVRTPAARHHAAHQRRDPGQRRKFQQANPCPSTGRRSGACPGYVVDHVRPLKRGGRDDPSNMRWQTTQDAKRKDRWE